MTLWKVTVKQAFYKWQVVYLTYLMEQRPSEANRFSVSQIPAFCWTRRFITTYTSARQLSLSWASSIHSMPPHPTSWRSILILSSHLCLGLPSGLFPHQNTVYASPLPHMCYMAHSSHSSRINHPNNIGWGVQIIKLLIMYFPILPYFLIPPRTKYSPEHPIREQPQTTLLPEYERPSFTPIKNNRENYSSLYLYV